MNSVFSLSQVHNRLSRRSGGGKRPRHHGGGLAFGLWVDGVDRWRGRAMCYKVIEPDACIAHAL